MVAEQMFFVFRIYAQTWIIFFNTWMSKLYNVIIVKFLQFEKHRAPKSL